VNELRVIALASGATGVVAGLCARTMWHRCIDPHCGTIIVEPGAGTLHALSAVLLAIAAVFFALSAFVRRRG
jgi:hypothetical protein